MTSVTIRGADGDISYLLKGFPLTTTVSKDDPTVGDVKATIAAKFPKFYVTRQKITKKGDRKALDDDTKLSEAGVELVVKDLGPQVDWRTVFLIEYAGPLIIHPLIFHFPGFFYGYNYYHSSLQKFAYTLIMLHFAKRELETLFVHRFSHATMPILNIFKNVGHYYLFGGVALAYDIYRPGLAENSVLITGTLKDDPRFLWGLTGLFVFAQLSNLRTHLTLRSLRPANTRVRAIPYGYGFSAPLLLSCPNYFFEITAWAAISWMTGSIASWTFTVIAAGQMGMWALKKHANYKKEFGKDYPAERWAMIPGII